MSTSKILIDKSNLDNILGIHTVFTECIFMNSFECAVDRPSLINMQISLKMDYKCPKNQFVQAK